MVRSLITALLLNLVMQVATSPLASAQIEMALDDVIVIDPALCGVTDFTPPEPIPTVCRRHAELGQTRGFLSDYGAWCVVAMEGKTEADIRAECQQPIEE